MKAEQMKISDEQSKQIASILQKQGFKFSEINEILNGEYTEFQTDMDLKDVFSSDGNHQNILRGLADGYSIEELQQQGVKPREIEEFMQLLEKFNFTVENAKAINQYSNGSNMILSMKKETANKSEIQKGIRTDMMSKLQTRGLSQKQISVLEDHIDKLDFNKPVHENYENISQYMQEMNIPHNCYPSICTAVKGMDSLQHIDSTLTNLDDGLSKARLPQSIKLYRAIKTNGEINPENYVGKSMSNNGYTSTSPLYESSFAKYDDYDTVMEIYAPKGTQGCYMTQLSDYDSAEQEVLLNSNDIYVVNAQKGVVDQNGRTKTVLKTLLLSKERECYKEIDKKQEFDKTQPSQEQYADTSYNQSAENNLPVKQNKFSRFFNQMSSRFTQKTHEDKKQGKHSNQAENKPQEKKSWELEPKEKTRIQKETAQIGKKYQEQKENNELLNQEQSPVQQQPIMDTGGMEL